MWRWHLWLDNWPKLVLHSGYFCKEQSVFCSVSEVANKRHRHSCGSVLCSALLACRMLTGSRLGICTNFDPWQETAQFVFPQSKKSQQGLGWLEAAPKLSSGKFWSLSAEISGESGQISQENRDLFTPMRAALQRVQKRSKAFSIWLLAVETHSNFYPMRIGQRNPQSTPWCEKSLWALTRCANSYPRDTLMYLTGKISQQWWGGKLQGLQSGRVMSEADKQPRLPLKSSH